MFVFRDLETKSRCQNRRQFTKNRRDNPLANGSSDLTDVTLIIMSMEMIISLPGS